MRIWGGKGEERVGAECGEEPGETGDVMTRGEIRRLGSQLGHGFGDLGYGT